MCGLVLLAGFVYVGLLLLLCVVYCYVLSGVAFCSCHCYVLFIVAVYLFVIGVLHVIGYSYLHVYAHFTTSINIF